MLRQQCKVQGLACKTSFFHRSTKTSAYKLGKGSTMLKGCSLQNITSYLQVYKRINPMKEYHIQLLTIKTARIQIIESKLTTFNFLCVQDIKRLKHYITSPHLWDHHQHIIIIMSKVNNNLRRFRRLSTNIVKVIKDDPYS